MKLKVPYYRQKKIYTCGPACLRMVLAYFGKKWSIGQIIRNSGTTAKYGTSPRKMVSAAKRAGLIVRVSKNSTLQEIRKQLDFGRPVVVCYREPAYNEGHYAVAVGYRSDKFIFNDPWHGQNFLIKADDFLKRWGITFRGRRYRRWLMSVERRVVRG